jgi:hypothetical protein
MNKEKKLKPNIKKLCNKYIKINTKLTEELDKLSKNNEVCKCQNPNRWAVFYEDMAVERCTICGGYIE